MSSHDWGLGLTNIDKETGIRFGVINQNECLQAWGDSAEGDYGDPHCPRCGDEALNVDDQPECNYRDDEEYERLPGSCDDYVCDKCKLLFDASDGTGDQPVAWVLDDGEYKATQGGDDCDIFVIKSPYYTRCEFCSPCAPGAGYLLNEGGIRAYCFSHDFFWDHPEHAYVAPYRVFRVEGDQEVFAIGEDVDCDQCKATGKDSLQRIAEIRGLNLVDLQKDSDLMARLQQLHFDEATGTFDCWACKGLGKVWTIVEHVGESSNCRHCDKPIIREGETWIDQTGGDVCGWDGGNESHEPTGEQPSHT